MFPVSDAAEKRSMTKADLIEEVSRLAELTRKDSEVIVETIFDSVVRALRSGDKIEIRGFGSFPDAGSASPVSAAIPRPVTGSRFRPRRFLSSSPARN